MKSPADTFLPRLNILSLRHLEHALGFSRSELRDLAAKAGAYYAPYEAPPKRRPFQKPVRETKRRRIDRPIGRLKVVQKAIQERLLKPLRLPGHIFGGISGVSTAEHARFHANALRMVTIDVESFFPSISHQQIFKVWKNDLGCSTEVSSLLTKLTTLEGHLPQGAPTSTALANILICTSDGPILDFCAEKRLQYGTFIDDLAITGEQPGEAVPVVVRTLRSLHLAPSRRKLRTFKAGQRKVLNGLVVGDVPRVPKEHLKQIRAGIHNLVVGRVKRHEIERYVNALEGRIANIHHIDPKKAACFWQKLEEALKIINDSVPNTK